MTDEPSDLPQEKYDPMRELEEHFARDGNPVFVLEAIDLARDNETPLPMWVVSYLFEAAHESMRILEAARAGEPILKEAELVGRAFGFRKGPGEGGWFQQAVAVRNDQQMFWDVVRATDPVVRRSGEKYHFVLRDKLIMAYDIVAAEWGVDPSTVVRAATRFLRRSGVKLEEDDEEYISTMQDFVRGRLRAYNEAIDLLEAARREREEDGGCDDK